MKKAARDAAYVEPINDTQRETAISQTHRYIDLATHLFDTAFPKIPIVFDLKGKCAGMYRIKNRDRIIRYNPFIFAKYFRENIDGTIPHEVAHYISDYLYGSPNIRPHGKEWKHIMHRFGKKPIVTGRYDLSGIPTRRFQYYQYRCSCRQHQLTKYRHNKIVNNRMRYYCRNCRAQLEAIA